MLPLEDRWIIEVLTVHLEVRIPEDPQPLTEDELDWNWHHWKKIESLLRYPEPYYARELTRIVLEINEAVNGTKERLYGDQRDFIIWERVFHDMESAATAGAFVITRVPEKKLPKLQPVTTPIVQKPQAVPDKEPEAKEHEFIVKVVDEIGRGVKDVPLVFRGAGTSKRIATDGSGVAKHKVAADSVEVAFAEPDAVFDVVKPMWSGRAATPPAKYLQPNGDIIAVAARLGSIEAIAGEVFKGISVPAGATKTITIRPAKKRAIFI